MAHAEDSSPSVNPVEPTPRARPHWATGMICLTILPLLGFIGQGGRSLWAEWSAFGREKGRPRPSVIGYTGISPNLSFAARPDDWIHDHEDRTLLWSGWDGGKNCWYAFGRGELVGLQLSFPMGRDTVRVIDRPIYRGSDDGYWSRVPDDAKVVPLDLGEAPTACPLLVLDKVEAINEVAGDRPVLVAYTPVVDEVAVYDAMLDGRRVMMGHSGFFDAHRPILYDRETVSFWVGRDGGLVAIAGPRKGSRLGRIARPARGRLGGLEGGEPRRPADRRRRAGTGGDGRIRRGGDCVGDVRRDILILRDMRRPHR